MFDWLPDSLGLPEVLLGLFLAIVLLGIRALFLPGSPKLKRLNQCADGLQQIRQEKDTTILGNGRIEVKYKDIPGEHRNEYVELSMSGYPRPVKIVYKTDRDKLYDHKVVWFVHNGQPLVKEEWENDLSVSQDKLAQEIYRKVHQGLKHQVQQPRVPQFRVHSL